MYIGSNTRTQYLLMNTACNREHDKKNHWCSSINKQKEIKRDIDRNSSIIIDQERKNCETIYDPKRATEPYAPIAQSKNTKITKRQIIMIWFRAMRIAVESESAEFGFNLDKKMIKKKPLLHCFEWKLITYKRNND